MRGYIPSSSRYLRDGFPSVEERKALGGEAGPNGEEISPAYCDEEDRAAILAKA